MPNARREELFRSFAATGGSEFVSEFDRNDLGVSKPFSTFDDWVSGTNLVRGRFGVTNFQLFDMARTVTSRDAEGHTSTSTSRKTAVVVGNTAKLPELRMMASRGIATNLFNLAGRVGLEFGVDGGFPEDAQVVRKFNHSWFVDGEGCEAGMEFRETPNGISLPLLKNLDEGRGWSIEVSGDHILFHIVQKRAPAEELHAIVSELQSLVAVLSDRSRTQLMVRRLRPPGMATLAGGLMWPFGGAVLGMLLTMVVFGGVFAVMGEMPTVAILCFPFVGMGFMVGGALLMAKLRRRRDIGA